MTASRLRAALDVLLGRIPDDRAVIRIDVIAAASGGDFEADARFELFTNGERAGYSLSPAEVKKQITERLDIDMRRIGGYAPPARSTPEALRGDDARPGR